MTVTAWIPLAWRGWVSGVTRPSEWPRNAKRVTCFVLRFGASFELSHPITNASESRAPDASL